MKIIPAMNYFLFWIAATGLQIYMLTKVIQDISKWTFIPYLNYAQCIAIVCFITMLQSIFTFSYQELELYMTYSDERKMMIKLGKIFSIGIFTMIYFLAVKWF